MKKIFGKFQGFLKWLFIYITICGLFSFNLFILEEGFQCIQFGTWAAQDAKRWDIVMEGVKLMEGTIKTLDIINYSVGYIQPLSWFAYRAYSKSSKYYTRCLESLVFAHAPWLLDGRSIEFDFKPKIVKKSNTNPGVFIYENGKIIIRSYQKLNKGKLHVIGIIEVLNDSEFCTIDMVNK